MPILDQGFVTSTATSWVIGLTIILWMIYDYFAFKNPARGDTISEKKALWSIRRPIIAFCWGVLMGHFFFYQIVLVVRFDMNVLITSLLSAWIEFNHTFQKVVSVFI